MCYVFDILPSQLNTKLWACTFEDLGVAMDLKVSHEMAVLTQNYESFIKVASKVLGGEEQKTKPVMLENVAQAKEAFKSMFG